MRYLKYVFNIIDSSMSKLDIRLQKHLNRVAYLTLEYAKRNNFHESMIEDLVRSSYLHDIGIINTGKVTNLLQLETDTLIEHSAFGYIYLKYYAKELFPAVMMYHHTPYDKIENASEYEKYLANIVNIADRIDFAIVAYIKSNTSGNIAEFVERYIKKFEGDFSEQVFKEAKVLLDVEVLQRCVSEEHIHLFRQYIENVMIDRESYYSMLESIVYLIESHSVLTAGHSHIVATTASMVAKMLGMDESKQSDLYYAGILHDIGKIAIPLEILKKPGNLTDDEFVVMKGHMLHSVDILKDNVPDELYFPAIRHHENLKGTGYPYGDSKLTIEDEVLRVSDLLAALAERRYYRDALPIEKVIEILSEDHDNGNSSESVYNVVIENIDELYNQVAYEQDERMSQYKKIIDIYTKAVENLGLVNAD